MYDKSVSIIQIAIGKFLQTEVKFLSPISQKVVKRNKDKKEKDEVE